MTDFLLALFVLSALVMWLAALIFCFSQVVDAVHDGEAWKSWFFLVMLVFAVPLAAVFAVVRLFDK